MHVLDALADLSHEKYTVPLGEREVVGDHPLEQLATGNAEKVKRNVMFGHL